jgi:hypothetical protein
MRARGVGQVMESLPSKSEALSSNPSTTKKKKKIEKTQNHGNAESLKSEKESFKEEMTKNLTILTSSVEK